MTKNDKFTDNGPVQTKSVHPTCPGPKRETKAERLMRYEAQEISRLYGISMEQAMNIARHQAAEAEKARQKRQSREAKAKLLKRERQHDRSKRDTRPVVNTRGPPLRGGAPGLGKR